MCPKGCLSVSAAPGKHTYTKVYMMYVYFGSPSAEPPWLAVGLVSTDNIRNLQGVFAVPISEKKLKELADGNIDIYSIFADRSEELTFSHCGIERKADFKEIQKILPKPGVKLKWFGSHRKKFEKYMEGFNE